MLHVAQCIVSVFNRQSASFRHGCLGLLCQCWNYKQEGGLHHACKSNKVNPGTHAFGSRVVLCI